MAISKEVKVGLLALVAGIILYVGFNFLKGIDFFSPTNRYYVIYENISGLSVSNPVTLNGMTVGRVEQTKLLTNMNNSILVTLEVDDEIKIGDSTLAVLRNSSFLGGKEINLVLGNNTKELKKGDTLQGDIKKEITDMIGEKAMPVIDQLDTLILNLNHVFNKDFNKNLKNTMNNFEAASGDLKETLAKSKANIGQITGNLSDLTASLKETEKQFRPIIAKFNKLADSLNDLELKRVVNNANLAMKNIHDITTKITDSKGTLGMLINDKTLYENLTKSTNSLDTLLRHIEYNPRHFFAPFGKKPKK